MPKNRKTFGVPAPHTRSGNKISVGPINGHRSGQVNRHRNNKIHKKDEYTTGRKGGIHQIGGRSETKQGSALNIENVHRRRQDGKRDGDYDKNSRPHHMQKPYEWSGLNTKCEICRQRRNFFNLNTPLKKNRYGKVRAKYIPEEKTRKHKL